MLCVIMELKITPNKILLFQMNHSYITNGISRKGLPDTPLPQSLFTGVLTTIFTGYLAEVSAKGQYCNYISPYDISIPELILSLMF